MQNNGKVVASHHATNPSHWILTDFSIRRSGHYTLAKNGWASGAYQWEFFSFQGREHLLLFLLRLNPPRKISAKIKQSFGLLSQLSGNQPRSQSHAKAMIARFSWQRPHCAHAALGHDSCQTHFLCYGTATNRISGKHPITMETR